MPKDPIEKAFLAELEAIEKFRISYTGAFPNVPLAREDPDVRRLIEAMAMFTARTRLAAERNVGQGMVRIFRQHFPFLLSPVPAMTMLKASPSSRYVDVTQIPRNTEVRAGHDPGRDAPERVYRFRTLAKLRILPIRLDSINLYRPGGRGFRIVLGFASAFPRNDEIGELRLYVNHLNDFLSSLTVLHALKTHLVSASVVFGEKVKDDTVGQPCEVSFGAPPATVDELDDYNHPLELARSFFRLPQQELYLMVHGIRAPRNWERFAVCLDVDEAWPTELRLSAEAFQLHVVPIVNVLKAMANPIECDGTRERWPVKHPEPSARYVPHSVLGVYRMTRDGLSPMKPAVVGARGDTYEAIIEGRGERRGAWVSLNLPDAFEEPERVVVDAMWHQPGLGGITASELRVRLADRMVDGVTFACAGPLVGHFDSDLEEDREALLQLLSIKNQRFLGLDDLALLLRALGADRQKYFSKVVASIRDLSVRTAPYARRSAGFKYTYEVTFDDLDSSDVPVVDLFCGKLLEILTAWSTEEIVELVARLPNLEKTFHYS